MHTIKVVEDLQRGDVVREDCGRTVEVVAAGYEDDAKPESVGDFLTKRVEVAWIPYGSQGATCVETSYYFAGEIVEVRV